MNNMFESFWATLFIGLVCLGIACRDVSYPAAFYAVCFLSLAVLNAHRNLIKGENK